jgi:Ca-activated chloride channel family protein
MRKVRRWSIGAAAAAAAAAVLLADGARGQEAGGAAERLRPPALLVRPEPEKPALPLRVVAAKVDVVVIGGIATTTLDLTFANDLDRVLEGELVLPLPEAATISRFALEVDGVLREASVVERERARVVFESIVRRGADPGLVEWTQGNAFRTRVYPIPAHGRKHLVLGYEESLREAGAGRAAYFLPLGFGGALERFAARIEVFGRGALVARDGARTEVAPPAGRPSFTETIDGAGIRPDDIRLELETPTAPEVAIEAARVVQLWEKEPDLVFVARVPVPPIPAARAVPRRVTVLWDASGSAASRDAAKERAFLEAYLAALGTAHVRLVVFSDAVWDGAGGDFDVADGRCPALFARLAAIVPDGGTRLAALDLARLDPETERYLLVSDGLATLGEGDPLPGRAPVTCVASGTTADWAALERIASGGGAVVRLGDLPPAEAAARALEAPAALLGVDYDGARVAGVLPAAPARLDGRILTITGRVRSGAAAKLVLHFGRAGRETARLEVPLDTTALSETGAVERLIAARTVASLLARPAPDEAEIVRLAKAHGLVTPLTSLLVLETLDDYVRYRVLPPPGELREAYLDRIEREKQAAAKSREERLAALRRKWKERVAWWETKFDYPSGFRWKEAAKDEVAEGEGRGNEPAAGPRPAAPAQARLGPALAGDGHDRGGAPGERADLTAKKPEGARGDAPGAIALKPWDPETPYLAALRKAETADALYAAYLAEKPQYAASTAFFLDVADLFFERKLDALGVRVLSNIAEMRLGSAPLLRILGYRLRQAGAIDLAIAVFREVTRIRPEEPQSWRDLGLTLADAKDWAGAVANLEKVSTGAWDDRFPDIDLIALGELNDVLRRAREAGAKPACGLPADLLRPLDCDLRIILTWDADACDMDLWVTEPSGEKAFYGHTATTTGGAFGRDFTRGYGPEEYLVHRAMQGPFRVQVNYYGNTQQIIAGATTIQVTIIKNYGRPDEERKEVTRRLKEKQEVLDIAEVIFP